MKQITFETEQQTAACVIDCEMRGRKFAVTGRKSMIVFD